MDRKVLIQLLRDGMRYPTGKHRFWISRCFEITVRPDRKVVELDEYESFLTEDGSRSTGKGLKRGDRSQMYHVGKSVLHLKDGRLLEEFGSGWQDGSLKRS